MNKNKFTEVRFCDEKEFNRTKIISSFVKPKNTIAPMRLVHIPYYRQLIIGIGGRMPVITLHIYFIVNNT